MSKTQNSLLLLIILGITVACASTSDGSLGSVPSRTAAGKTIPTFIRDEFVEIRGSETILGQLKENVSFSTSSTVNYTTEVAAINTFQILRSEVTIQMYVEFLNSEPFVASNTGGSSTATNGLGNRDDYFKSGMSNDFLAGIFRTDSSGGLVLGDVDELGSDFIESSTSADDTFRIKANNYSDPFKVLEKPRQATDLEVIYNIIPGRSSYPIPFVTKRAAIEFCAWLGPQYRLPTGNEWEYAARGGAPASAIIDFPFTSSDLTRVPTEVVSASSGDPIIDAYLNQMHLIANFQGEFNESPGPAPVMSYKPNGYGIYDTMGNLYEWTASSVFEGTGGITASLGTSHLRGGSWASRNFHNLSVWGKIISAGDENYFGDTGFRIVFQKATVFTAENLAQNQ